MLYKREPFSPRVILWRIFVLQVFLSLVLTLTHVILVAPYHTDDEPKKKESSSGATSTMYSGPLLMPLDWTLIRFDSFQGIMVAASYGISSIIMAVCIWKLIKRSSKCADYAFTMFFIHACVCWIYGRETLGFPNSAAFWTCIVSSFALTAVLSERICMWEELQEIPLSTFEPTHTHNQEVMMGSQGQVNDHGDKEDQGKLVDILYNRNHPGTSRVSQRKEFLTHSNLAIMSMLQHGSWTLRKAKASSFIVGCFSGLGLLAYTRISLWRKDAEVLREYPALASQENKEGHENDTILFGRVMRQYLIHHWNTDVVDAVAKPAIECLASKGW